MIAWGITDGSAGMKSQVSGVLHALGGTTVLKTAKRKRPWCWLPGTRYDNALSQLTVDSDALQPPWPDIVIGSGRRAAAITLAIKAASGGKTKAVHLTDPRIDPALFDLVVAMAHDETQGPNVMKTRFALHRLTPEILAEEAEKWSGLFSAFPTPRVAVLLGGSTNKYTLRASGMRAVCDRLKMFRQATNASLLITPSRRTGEKNIQRLKEAFLPAATPGEAAQAFNTYIYTLKGENPYLGMLALTDAIIVTDDSVNMMSETAYTGKPLYILPLPKHAGTKPARFAAGLIESGIAKPLGNTLERWGYAIEDERAKVVERVRGIISS